MLRRDFGFRVSPAASASAVSASCSWETMGSVEEPWSWVLKRGEGRSMSLGLLV